MGGGVSHHSSNFKSQGDDCFRVGQFSEAVYWYTKSISDDLPNINDKSVEAAIYSNRSAAYEAYGQPQTALNDALKVIEIRPDWTKGYYRAFRAQISLGQIDDAKQSLATVIALSPDDKKTISELETKLRTCEAEKGNKSTSVSANGISWVYSWGSNSSSQLGHGSANQSDKAIPTMIKGFHRKYIMSVACGAMHNVAVSSIGETYTWGNNSYQQLGLPASLSATADNSTSSGAVVGAIPLQIPKLIGVCITAVACGAGHSVAISSVGRVYCWGVGKQGQLGLGNYESVLEPSLVTSLLQLEVVAVSCGISHTYFLTGRNEVFSTGSNTYGQLGLSSTPPEHSSAAGGGPGSSGGLVHTPTLVPLGSGVTVMHIACGGGSHPPSGRKRSSVQLRFQ